MQACLPSRMTSAHSSDIVVRSAVDSRPLFKRHIQGNIGADSHGHDSLPRLENRFLYRHGMIARRQPNRGWRGSEELAVHCNLRVVGNGRKCHDAQFILRGRCRLRRCRRGFGWQECGVVQRDLLVRTNVGDEARALWNLHVLSSFDQGQGCEILRCVQHDRRGPIMSE